MVFYFKKMLPMHLLSKWKFMNKASFGQPSGIFLMRTEYRNLGTV